MPWPLKLVVGPGEDIGDCWYAPGMIGEYRDHYMQFLSVEYKTQWLGKRPPIVVRFPPGFDFCIDEGAHNHGQYSEHGWTVTGELPNITVTPSINAVGIYHGFIQNGVLTDDCEGRRF